MASSSSQRGATRRAPPPPDQLASFNSLVDKCVHAGVLNRHARSAELSAKAATKGEALFGDNSLVVANLRMNESMSLVGMAAEASGAEQKAFLRRSWGALLSVIAILQSRVAANTLLPGTVRKEEMDFYAYQLRAAFDAQNKPIPSPTELWDLASTVGYAVLLDALHRSLNFLFKTFVPLWQAAQQKIVESFVFQALDFIPRTAGLRRRPIAGESAVLLRAAVMPPRKPSGEPTSYHIAVAGWPSLLQPRVNEVYRCEVLVYADVGLSSPKTANSVYKVDTEGATPRLRCGDLPVGGHVFARIVDGARPTRVQEGADFDPDVWDRPLFEWAAVNVDAPPPGVAYVAGTQRAAALLWMRSLHLTVVRDTPRPWSPPPPPPGEVVTTPLRAGNCAWRLLVDEECKDTRHRLSYYLERSVTPVARGFTPVAGTSTHMSHAGGSEFRIATDPRFGPLCARYLALRGDVHLANTPPDSRLAVRGPALDNLLRSAGNIMSGVVPFQPLTAVRFAELSKMKLPFHGGIVKEPTLENEGFNAGIYALFRPDAFVADWGHDDTCVRLGDAFRDAAPRWNVAQQTKRRADRAYEDVHFAFARTAAYRTRSSEVENTPAFREASAESSCSDGLKRELARLTLDALRDPEGVVATLRTAFRDAIETVGVAEQALKAASANSLDYAKASTFIFTGTDTGVQLKSRDKAEYRMYVDGMMTHDFQATQWPKRLTFDHHFGFNACGDKANYWVMQYQTCWGFETSLANFTWECLEYALIAPAFKPHPQHGAQLPLRFLDAFTNVLGTAYALISDPWTDDELRRLASASRSLVFVNDTGAAVTEEFKARVLPLVKPRARAGGRVC